MKKSILFNFSILTMMIGAASGFFSKTLTAHAESMMGKSIYTDVNGSVLSITTQPEDFAFEFNVIEDNESQGKLELLHASSSLTNITFFDSIEYKHKSYYVTELRGNGPYDIYCFREYTNLQSIILPASIEKIGEGTFQGCTSLTNVVISGDVQTIGGGTFYGCSNLTSITIDAIVPPELGNNVFTNCSDNLKIYVPSSSLSAYKEASSWSDFADLIIAKSPKVSDLLDTVPGGFPSSEGSSSPDDAWIKANNLNLKAFVNKSANTLNFGGTDCSFTLNDCVTEESENKYKIESSMFPVYFYLEDEVLTSVEVGNNQFLIMIIGKYSKPITVTFDVQGKGENQTKVIPSGNKVEELNENPSADGFDFAGWYTDSECLDGNNFSFDTILTNDITLFAKWVAEGPVVTLADILPDDFPVTNDNGWSNGIEKIYMSGESANFDSTIPLNTVVTSNGDNYILERTDEWMDTTFTVNYVFKMTNGKLTSIVISGAFMSDFDGEFLPPLVDPVIENPDEEKIGGGAIAGICIGSIAGVCLISYVIMFFIWKKKDKAVKFLVPSFNWISSKIFKK